MLLKNTDNSTIIVFLLILIFSLCQNILFYGIPIELPALINQLPEEWSLPAIFNLVSQGAAISLIIIFLLRHLTKSKSYETITIIIILLISIITFIILGLIWHKTIIINNKSHSIYFLFFSFIIYVCEYSGSLLFLPYLDRYKTIMMRAYFLGDGISSGTLAILGFVQDSEKTQYIPILTFANQTIFIEQTSSLGFSVETYFFILSFILFCSLISFLILSITKIGQDKSNENDESIKLIHNNNNEIEEEQESQINNKSFNISNNEFYLLAMFWSCFITFGFLPGLQTYALASYSHDIYQKQLFLLKYHICGSISALIYVAANGLNHIVYILLNIHFHEVSGEKGLFWSCFMVQCGTVLGAILNYMLTVHFQLFKERFPCHNYVCS
ncbi:unnamed protein product [Adineta steineri]|uniref:Riboflavin transporter n=1 Tax=Adineta steineri TaxID=433720 RepID=A0A814Z2V6_9BILA|nr:unnamed protein product [Adineta steineri]CAF3964620.1 unnamed protein product [Adineta steineri]